MTRLLKQITTLALAALLLGGCASSPEEADKVGDWKDLEGRAMARWEAIIAGDYEAAYDYLSPGYRSGVSRQSYSRRYGSTPVQRNSVEYQETVCQSETRCEVRLMVGYAVENMLPGMDRVESKALVREDWILIQGAWFHAPEFK